MPDTTAKSKSKSPAHKDSSKQKAHHASTKPAEEKIAHKTAHNAEMASEVDKVITTTIVDSKPVTVEKEIKKVETKVNKKRNRFVLPVIGLLLLVIIAAGIGTWQYAINSPRYAYYELYQDAKAKDVDKFMTYVDSSRIAQNIAQDQSVFFQGQQVDINQVKFQLKGQLEYTIDKMAREGDLEQIFSYKPNNLTEAYKNDKIQRKDGKFIVTFSKPNKDNAIDGIGGYKTGIFEKENGHWKLTTIQDNAAVDAEKQKLQDSQKK